MSEETITLSKVLYAPVPSNDPCEDSGNFHLFKSRVFESKLSSNSKNHSSPSSMRVSFKITFVPAQIWAKVTFSENEKKLMYLIEAKMEINL